MTPARSALIVPLAAAFLALPPVVGGGKKDDPGKALAGVEAELGKRGVAQRERARIGKVASFLRKADAMEVLRLRATPARTARDGQAVPRHEILDRVGVTKAEQRAALAQSLSEGFHWNPLRQALCFNPRHGLVAARGKRTMELVICFECSRVDVYEGTEPLGAITTTAKSCPVMDRFLAAPPEATLLSGRRPFGRPIEQEVPAITSPTGARIGILEVSIRKRNGVRS